MFTIDENDYLTLYKIKSYLSAPMSSVITNFKMAKKTSVLLEYPVQTIEWMRPEGAKLHVPMMGTNGDSYRRSKHLLQPNFLVSYKDQPYIDYFDEKGSLMHRVDLS